MRKPTQAQRFQRAQENLDELTLALQMVDEGAVPATPKDKAFLLGCYTESQAKFKEIALEVIEA